MDARVRDTNVIRIFGSRVNMVNIAFILDWMEERIRGFDSREMPAGQLLVTGFHGLNQARKDPGYFRIAEQCDLWAPDSIAPVMVARMRGVKGAVRTPGAEIMDGFFQRADCQGYASYFYGDADPTLAALKQKLGTRYPGHRVAGSFSPPFRPLSAAEEDRKSTLLNSSHYS